MNIRYIRLLLAICTLNIINQLESLCLGVWRFQSLIYQC